MCGSMKAVAVNDLHPSQNYCFHKTHHSVTNNSLLFNIHQTSPIHHNKYNSKHTYRHIKDIYSVAERLNEALSICRDAVVHLQSTGETLHTLNTQINTSTQMHKVNKNMFGQIPQSHSYSAFSPGRNKPLVSSRVL